jgi:hypothetical protein
MRARATVIYGEVLKEGASMNLNIDGIAYKAVMRGDMTGSIRYMRELLNSGKTLAVHVKSIAYEGNEEVLELSGIEEIQEKEFAA